MRRFVAVCLGLCLLFGVVSQANSTSSLAWSKVYGVNGGYRVAEGVDPTGNVLFGTYSSTGEVSKFDPYGNQLWSTRYFIAAPFELYSVAGDYWGNAYVFGLIDSDPAAPILVFLKFSADGNLLWYTQIKEGDTLTPLAMQADGLGVRVAFNLLDNNLFAVYLDENGVQTGAMMDYSLVPRQAKFCIDGNLLAVGSDTGTIGNVRCTVDKPSGTAVLTYSAPGACYADSDGADNVYIAGDALGSNPSFQFLKYDQNGVQQWVSNPASGTVNGISTAFYNQIFVNNLTTGQLELFDPDLVPFPQSGAPTPVFANSVTFDSMAADPGGGVLTVKGNVFRRYDLQGMLTWAQTFTVANVASPAFQNYSVPAVGGSQLGPDPVYFAGQGLISGSNYVLFVGKYVVSTALLGLTLSPTYVTGGSPVVGTVKLNATAPSGGASVALSSSIPALANPPAKVTIAQGSTMGTFAASTPPVDVAAAVTLSASYGGVQRSAVVNVIPATLFSVTTPVSMAKGGTYVTGTVHLTGRAGPAGRSAALSSSNTAAASVPTGVNVAPYASSVNFVIATHAVSANTAVTLTARSGTLTKTATLTVTP